MAQLLIEENFEHLDGQDVEDLIEAFQALGLRAEPTQPRTAPQRRGWVLVLHWLREGEEARITDASLCASVVDVVRSTLTAAHPTGLGGTCVRGRTLPLRIEVRARDGALLTSLAMPAR
ncbi:hypothetical protein [Streptacidiphilus rugosus]|uniref:hypothetical protein n=1 Tax=Streptacidiphilus rugosus TaxID=405783 RepID=UPI000559ED57|nr:hypothetical protein [Streptacidiphilus rugosus]